MIDGDPWGFPFKLVLKKLKLSALGMTQALKKDTLMKLLDSLFPRNSMPDPIEDWSNFDWSNEWDITIGEVNDAVRKVSFSPTKAPGPDGFRKLVFKLVTDEFLEWIRHTLNLCF